MVSPTISRPSSVLACSVAVIERFTIKLILGALVRVPLADSTTKLSHDGYPSMSTARLASTTATPRSSKPLQHWVGKFARSWVTSTPDSDCFAT